MSIQFNENILLQACRNNDLSLVESMTAQHKISHELINKCFYIACEHNCLNLAKLLHSLGDIDINIKHFKFSCINGSLDIARWLLASGDKKYHDNIRINSYNVSELTDIFNSTFELTCMSGQLDVCKWLYESYEAHTDSHKEFCFELTCEYGELDVAKWLYSIGNINIRTNYDYAFKSCCKNGYINVAKWLCTLYPGYKVNVIDNEIQYSIN